MNKNTLSAVSALTYLALQSSLVARTIYVDDSARGLLLNGNSWEDAYHNLQDALVSANSGDEILVVAGTYVPDEGSGQTNNDRNSTFQLTTGVDLYGGYPVGGGSRDLSKYSTILSGDLSGDDSTGGDNSENAYHVVTGSGTDATAIIDGFTITGGNSTNNGAGMTNVNGTPTVINCIFTGNSATVGAAITYFNPILTTSTISNCVFFDNTASNQGGAIYNYQNSPTITNCTFSSNSAGSDGGAIYNISADPALTNSILWNNQANGSTSSTSASVYNSSASPTYTFCLIANSGGSSTWQSSIGTDNGNNSDTDPLFRTSSDLRLQGSSPVIDAGKNSVAAATDILGNDHNVDGDSNGNSKVDRGAYEFQLPIFVDSSATSGNDNGLTWENAFLDLQSALASAAEGDDIFVATGTYYPDLGTGQSDNDRDSTFQLKNGVGIYGGYPVGGGLRDLATQTAILSGDLLVDDSSGGDNSENANHVLTGNSTDATAILDGFTVTSGNADTGNDSNKKGAALINNTGSPTVRNCSFISNSAALNAGAVFNLNGSPSYTNCIFSGNSATNNAGAVANSKATVNFTNCVFSGNLANNTGGALSNYQATAIFNNCTFSGNRALVSAGAIRSIESDSTHTNCILWNNQANGSTSGTLASLENDADSTQTFSHCLIANSGGSANWSNDIGTDNGNNSDTDPLFKIPASPSSAPTISGDRNLHVLSPAVDQGDNSIATSTDLDGQTRRVDGDGNGSLSIDLGAYELLAPLLVDASATSGNNDGSTWSNAFINLQSALASATSGDNILVAAGIYYPDLGSGQVDNNNSATFQLISDIALYGSYPTGGGARDLSAHDSILSGDIDQDGSSANNSNNVVTGSGTDNSAILDGFSITSGNNIFTGAGLYNATGSPTVNNCAFTENSSNNGGAIANTAASSPNISNCTFSSNVVSNLGGAIYNDTNSSPTISNCVFIGNSANYGAAIGNVITSSPTILSCSFSGNKATTSGGCLYNYGNSAPTITNCILWNNSAANNTTSSSASVENNSSTPTFAYNLIANSGSSSSWNSNIGSDSGNNLNSDPLFLTSSAPSAAPTKTGDLRLSSSSPAIETGDNSVAAPTDITGFSRINNYSGFGLATIDIGAYEHVQPFVDSSATSGNNDGSSWADAYTDLQTAITQVAAASGGDILVAAGTYYPDDGSGQTNDSRASTFKLTSGTALYGGHPTGGGTRDASTHITILSGDIDQDSTSSGNARHVLTCSSGTDSSAILDGFTVTAGNANGGSSPKNSGGGLYCADSSPTLSDIIFLDNNSSSTGGAINCVTKSSPMLTGCTFTGNTSKYGGAISNDSVSSPSFIDCDFTSNSARNLGGAIDNYNNSAPTFTSCSFTGNSVTGSASERHGGAISSGGSSPTFTDCSFLANSTTGNGGAFYCDDESEAEFTNCSFSNNNATDAGGAVSNKDSSPKFTNCSFAGNSSSGDGGGMHNKTDASPTLINCLITGNASANNGGGFYNETNSNPLLVNCTISGNLATLDGGAISNYDSSRPQLKNSILWSNLSYAMTTSSSSTVYNDATSNCDFNSSNIEHAVRPSGQWNNSIGTNTGSNFVGDPLFFIPVDPATAPTTSGNHHVLSGSNGINSGKDSSNTTTSDLDGNARFSGTIDLGCYEGGVTSTFATRYPSLNATDDNNGNGTTNYAEYAMGADPSAQNGSTLSPSISGTQLTLNVRAYASDVNTGYLKSTNLTDWDPMILNTDYTVNSSSTNGVQTTLTLDLIIDPEVKQIFYSMEMQETP